MKWETSQTSPHVNRRCGLSSPCENLKDKWPTHGWRNWCEWPPMVVSYMYVWLSNFMNYYHHNPKVRLWDKHHFLKHKTNEIIKKIKWNNWAWVHLGFWVPLVCLMLKNNTLNDSIVGFCLLCLIKLDPNPLQDFSVCLSFRISVWK